MIEREFHFNKNEAGVGTCNDGLDGTDSFHGENDAKNSNRLGDEHILMTLAVLSVLRLVRRCDGGVVTMASPVGRLNAYGELDVRGV